MKHLYGWTITQVIVASDKKHITLTATSYKGQTDIWERVLNGHAFFWNGEEYRVEHLKGGNTPFRKV